MTYPGKEWRDLTVNDIITNNKLNVALDSFSFDISNNISNNLHLYNVPTQNVSSKNPKKIIWSNIGLKDDIYDFSPGTSNVIINKTGVFRIDAEITLTTKGNSRTEALTETFLNDNVIPGSAMYSYHRNKNQGTTSVSSSRIIYVNEGDIIEIQSRKESGGNLTTVPEGCRLSIQEMI